MATTRPRGDRPAAPPPSRQAVVERAEAYVRAHLDAPPPVKRLCVLVGVSERGLRNAFHGIRGASPTRCLRAERLEAVRRALIDAADRTATVTAIATDHGFYQLGRFAATYRHAFGETPSETLRGHARAQANEGTDGCWHALEKPSMR